MLQTQNEYKDSSIRPNQKTEPTFNPSSDLLVCYKQFIPNYSHISEPLLRLVPKNAKFIWTQEQEQSFINIKEGLKRSTYLAHFDPNKRTELRVDASGFALGGPLISTQ